MTVCVLWLFLTVPWVGLQCVIVVFPDHTHLLVFFFCCFFFKKSIVRSFSMKSVYPFISDLRVFRKIAVRVFDSKMSKISFRL